MASAVGAIGAVGQASVVRQAIYVVGECSEGEKVIRVEREADGKVAG